MRRQVRRWLPVLTAVSVLVAAVAVPAAADQAGGDRDRGVVAWIDRQAVPLASTDPRDPLDDLRPLGRMVGGAPIVGLGESTHGSREQFRVKHRLVRFLVERMGFRTLGLEEDFAGGVLLDLRAPAPRAVRDWRDGPATMRMIHPSYAEDDDGAGHTMTVPSLAGAFDVLVHVRATTPTRPSG